MTTLMFLTQFYLVQKNALLALIIGYFWVILVGNGMFYFFPPSYASSFSIWVHKIPTMRKHFMVVLY